MGKKRTSKAKHKLIEERKVAYHIAKDPYADMGATVNSIEKRSIANPKDVKETTNQVVNSTSSQPTESAAQRYKIISQDPYATLGVAIRRGHFPITKDIKRHHKMHVSATTNLRSRNFTKVRKKKSYLAVLQPSP